MKSITDGKMSGIYVEGEVLTTGDERKGNESGAENVEELGMSSRRDGPSIRPVAYIQRLLRT